MFSIVIMESTLSEIIITDSLSFNTITEFNHICRRILQSMSAKFVAWMGS